MLNFNIFRALLRTTYTIFFSFIIEQFFSDSVFFFQENLVPNTCNEKFLVELI